MITSITIGGLALGYENGYNFEKFSGFESPEIRPDIKNRGYANGASFGSIFFGQRKLSIEGEIWGDDPSDYEDKRNALVGAVNPLAEAQQMAITTRRGVSLIIDVITTAIDIPYQKGDMIRGKFRIDFSAVDPYFKGATLQSQELPVSTGGGFAIPFAVPLSIAGGGTGVGSLTNSGNAAAFPEITIYGTLTNPTLTNLTNSEGFSITGSLSTSGDYFRIKTIDNYVYLNDITNYRAFFSGDFLTLAPGVNEIKLTAGSSNSNARVVIEWRNHYLGI